MIYLAREPVSVKVARDYVGKIAAESWPVDEYTVRVVTSELVTNAVRHARTDMIKVNAYAENGVYVVEVWDADETMPTLHGRVTAGEGGWGLAAVAQYASNWGVRRDESGGKTVYAEWTAA